MKQLLQTLRFKAKVETNLCTGRFFLPAGLIIFLLNLSTWFNSYWPYLQCSLEYFAVVVAGILADVALFVSIPYRIDVGVGHGLAMGFANKCKSLSI